MSDPSPYIPVTAADGTLYVVPLPPRVLDLIASLTGAGECMIERPTGRYGVCAQHQVCLDPGEPCPHAEARALIAAATEEGLMTP